jgi:endopolyphosphatase
MRPAILLLATLGLAQASPILQEALRPEHLGDTEPETHVAPRRLQGRFLHITGKSFARQYPYLADKHLTDFHPDPFYKLHSSTDEVNACHRGTGVAGTYGAETSDCDTPFSLVNATFKWIEENIKDKVDFVVWTGDSSRHDSDESLPRSEDQVLQLNRYIAGKFQEVFAEEDETGRLAVPIIPTFGNNDILPHNILLAGPNKWLRTYSSLWGNFIPEEQRHGFDRGGWFYVEVIPNKLAVFSLNTLYFFDHNAAVDGCAAKSEPGYEHMEWLRIQLQFMRDRGMKAILMGHVPPARTESKQLWDETCWQKYTLWLKQYRDVVLAGLFGHMNIDHFMLQDTDQINLEVLAGAEGANIREHLDDELSIQSASDYLEELRLKWSGLPNPSVAERSIIEDDDVSDSGKKSKKGKKGKGKKDKKDKALKRIGGPWAERYHLTHVSPSIVPNFFPTLRVIEYNLTGIDASVTWSGVQSAKMRDFIGSDENIQPIEEVLESMLEKIDGKMEDDSADGLGKKHKKKKPKKPSNPNLNIPDPPSKLAPPGPAYSPQSLTLLGYTQYYANLTHINNDLTKLDFGDDGNESNEDVNEEGWHGGKHKDKLPKDKVPHPKKFKFEVEYSTFSDSKGFKLQDMTVRSYLRLAHRIGKYAPKSNMETHSHLTMTSSDYEKDEVSNRITTWTTQVYALLDKLVSQLRLYGVVVSDWSLPELSSTVSDASMEEDDSLDECDDEDELEDCDDLEIDKKKGGKKQRKHKKKKHHRGHNKNNKAWYTFIRRAFVGTMDDEEIEEFQLWREKNKIVDAREEL